MRIDDMNETRALLRKRARKLTRREKIIASGAGYVPREWTFAGEDDKYLLLERKRDGKRAYVPKHPGEDVVTLSVIAD